MLPQSRLFVSILSKVVPNNESAFAVRILSGCPGWRCESGVQDTYLVRSLKNAAPSILRCNNLPLEYHSRGRDLRYLPPPKSNVAHANRKITRFGTLHPCVQYFCASPFHFLLAFSIQLLYQRASIRPSTNPLIQTSSSFLLPLSLRQHAPVYSPRQASLRLY